MADHTHPHHDTGYKELFSYPEFVQALIEGFTLDELAALMDFSTLKNHSGHYITPLFEEKIEDLVWSVDITFGESRQRLFLYILLEFQSKVDLTMPIRLLHYVACFYDHLIKTGQTTPSQGLPPVFPVLVYNGSRRWTAQPDMYELIHPEPPVFLHRYQPHLRYYVIDIGRYTQDELDQRPTPLSGVFQVENVVGPEQLHHAIERMVALIQSDPNRGRIDKVVTRWLKRHLKRLGAEVNVDPINSVVEDKAMLAENLEQWIEQERQKWRQEGWQEGRQEGQEGTLRKLITLKFGELPAWADERLTQASDEQLDVWVARILTADSLEGLLGD